VPRGRHGTGRLPPPRGMGEPDEGVWHRIRCAASGAREAQGSPVSQMGLALAGPHDNGHSGTCGPGSFGSRDAQLTSRAVPPQSGQSTVRQ
jgi:hypothetical protein